MAKPCTISCLLSGVFILSMIYMTYSVSNDRFIQTYENQLPENLKKIYKAVVSERSRIYYFGYVLGFILAAVIIAYNTQINKNKMGWTSMVCLTIIVSFFTSYFYYILSPKKNWMLENISTEEQTKAWLTMYRKMQYYYHSAFVFGILGVGFFSLAFRCY